MVSILALLSIKLSSVYLAQAACTAPISLTIANVTVEQNALVRGVVLPLGSPPQVYVLNAYGGLNNTYLPDPAVTCPSGTSTQKCIAINGGQFNPVTSTTWAEAANMAASGAASENQTAVEDGTWGTDTIHTNGSFSLSNFPFVISKNQGGHYGGGILGLGKDSTMLKALTGRSIIPSNSFSYWWGRQGAEQADQMNGGLVLGGYDQAKTAGANLTKPLSNAGNCDPRVIVDITSMNIRAANGTKADLFKLAGLSTVQACVDTTYPLITTPLPVWEAFTGATGTKPLNRSFGLNSYGFQFLANNVFDGDLEITLSNSLTVTIPNKQLVLPELDYGDDGRPLISNDSTREVLINSLQQINRYDMPLLGRVFLTSAYLHVNNEKEEWTMWQANPTTDQNIIAIPGKVDSTCSPSSTASSSSSAVNGITAVSTSTAGNGDNTPAPVKSAVLGTAAIVGIVIGATALLVLLAILGLFLIRKRRKAATTKRLTEMYPAASRLDDPQVADMAKSKRNTSVNELHSEGVSYELSPGQPRQYFEVPDSQLSVSELPSYSRYSDRLPVG